MVHLLPHIHSGLAAAAADSKHKRILMTNNDKRADKTCNLQAGDLYTYPNSTSPTVTLSASSQLTFAWDPTCLPNTTSSDLYLYTPSSGLIHAWVSVPFQQGSYLATLRPEWWNNTAKATLQLSIVDSNTPRFLTQSPAGPVFTLDVPQALLTATTTAATSTLTKQTATNSLGSTVVVDPTSTDSSGVFQIVSLPGQGGKHSLAPGALAAAILVPLLVVGLAVGVYVRFARAKEAEKRKRWSETVDKRMSTLSGDWRAGAGIAPARTSGVGAGGRRSIALSAADRQTKASSYFGRTSSNFAVEGSPNMAGQGAGAGAGASVPRVSRIAVPSYLEDGAASPSQQPEMSQIRSSIFLAGSMDAVPRDRSSRVSFAESNQQAPRMSRVSFGDALRPTISNPTSSNSNNNNKRSIYSSTNQTTPERIHHATAGNANKYGNRARPSLDGGINVSPSQAQGPFSLSETHLPTMMAPPTTTSSGGFGGTFSKLSGLVGALGLGAVIGGSNNGSGKKEDRNHHHNVDLTREKTREEEFRQAELTRRSGEGLRDLEATLLARRSKAMSGYSANSPSVNNVNNVSPQDASNNNHNNNDHHQQHQYSIYGDGLDNEHEDRMEQLDEKKDQEVRDRAASPITGMAPPVSGLSPDELLAAYAKGRQQSSRTIPGTTPIGSAIDQSQSQSQRQQPQPPQSSANGHLRPNSTVGATNNPFRQSMMSDDGSRYSGISENK